MNVVHVTQRTCVGTKELAAWLVALSMAGCFSDSPEQLLASAKSHLEGKDRKAAVIQLKNALQANANLAEARFLLGKILLENGDVEGAAIELSKARDSGYAHDELRALLGRTLFQQGQLDKLQAEYGQAELATPEAMADLQATLASAYAMRGKLVEARATIDKALKLDAGSLRVQLVHIRLLASDGGVVTALPVLERVLGKQAGSAEAWQLMGEFQALIGRTEEAILAFRESLKLDNSNVAAHTGLLSLLTTKRDREAVASALADFKARLPNHPQLRLFMASQAMEAGDLKTAREYVQVLLKGAPDDGRVQFLAGAIEFRGGALVQAESHLSKALRVAPNARRVRLLLARTHLRSGEAAKALNVLRFAIDGGKADADIFAAAAEAHFQLGNAELAEGYLRQAVKLNPQDARSRTALAVASIGKGRGDQGFDELRAISEEDSGTTADLALISTLMRRGEAEKALKAIDALELKQPTKPLAQMLRGGVEIKRGNQTQARAAFEAALKVDPVYFPAVSSLASMDVADKKPELAVKRFEDLLEKDPWHEQAQMAIVGLRAQAGAPANELVDLLTKAVKKNPDALAPRVALVRLQLERKDVKLALATVQEGVAASPDSPELHELLGRVQMVSGENNQALAAFNKMAALQPTSPQPFMRMAELYMANKDTAAAVQSLKRALSVKADFAPARAALVALDMAAGRVTEARIQIRAMQKQSPQDPRAYELEGDLETQQKNWPKAVAAYRANFDIRAQTDSAIKLHRSLIMSGKRTEATTFEATWRKRNPGDSAFVFYLGDSALLRSDHGQALGHYRDVLKLQPDNAAANNNIAWLLHKTKRSGALAYAEKANRLRPDHPAFLDTLAEIHASEGDLNKALELQKQAVALAPQQHMHRLHLARYYIKTGQKNEARGELLRLAALGDKFDQASEVKRLQAEL
ncbi:XrtA/PEP-CTERM system TPR-repeat protein PrsT [Paucibacter sp. XJ19-41]|uniref:XrtA/PEP-CTERM system TPR-repeat protein PrsT n=1 Tax=Paucibacter sp. XJ19-41 TaxID=2927824 RepID=UPI00234AEDD7|nr:XrtA/PEP-CTERM system TPR-repeat protein PrsT [Paucibacter sp. XJ19-41]MDC6170076.1 PEP-CTERM system TPR-repeat protein PrsT [Paucibacter sp. XJ19-41]